MSVLIQEKRKIKNQNDIKGDENMPQKFKDTNKIDEYDIPYKMSLNKQ